MLKHKLKLKKKLADVTYIVPRIIDPLKAFSFDKVEIQGIS